MKDNIIWSILTFLFIVFVAFIVAKQLGYLKIVMDWIKSTMLFVLLAVLIIAVVSVIIWYILENR